MRRSRIPRRAISKRAGPACAAGAPTWWNNAQGLNPCDVYQAILDKCGYVAPAITSDESYFPILQAESCMCNTITYNLGSACQDCQRGTTDQGILFSQYSTGGDGCVTTSLDLPESAMPTEDIPLWSYQDTSAQFWTYRAAEEIATNSTLTSSTPSGPSSTATFTFTEIPTFTIPDPANTGAPTETPMPSTSKSTNAGAIGGGVAGGVVLVLAVIGLLVFLRRRRAKDSTSGPETVMTTVGGGGRNASTSSESSLTESGKVAGSTSHYTPHSQMGHSNHNGSGVNLPTHSTTSALSSPIDAPPVPTLPHEYTPSTPARSLAASPTPSAPPVQKVKRVPVRYSEDELAQAEEEEAKRAAQHQS